MVNYGNNIILITYVQVAMEKSSVDGDTSDSPDNSGNSLFAL